MPSITLRTAVLGIISKNPSDELLFHELLKLLLRVGENRILAELQGNDRLKTLVGQSVESYLAKALQDPGSSISRLLVRFANPQNLARRKVSFPARSPFIVRGKHTLGFDVHKPGEGVKLDGVPKPLTPTEFKILEFLSRPDNINQVRSREDIGLAVWESNISEHKRLVDVHIRRLRERIEPDPSDPVFIITVRGFGYQLEGNLKQT